MTTNNARAVEAAHRAAAYLRRFLDRIRELVRPLTDMFRRLVEHLRNRQPSATADTPRPSRPAWMSPFGPPTAVHCR